MLTTTELKKLFEYDPVSGDLVWKLSRGGKKAGELAGGLFQSRGVVVTIDAKTYMAHDIIWQIVKGRKPANRIRHLNGDRADLRWDNLTVFKKQRKPTRDRIDIGIEIHPRGVRLISYKYGAIVDLGVYPDLEEAIKTLRIVL